MSSGGLGIGGQETFADLGEWVNAELPSENLVLICPYLYTLVSCKARTASCSLSLSPMAAYH